MVVKLLRPQGKGGYSCGGALCALGLCEVLSVLSVQWSWQGVLLMNASLTVRAHQANSHAKTGWQDFAKAAVKALSMKRKGLVFLLWGRNAQAFEPLIAGGRHHVLKSAHPSGLSANRVSGWPAQRSLQEQQTRQL